MPSYNYPNDGKFHTRFSELCRVTDGSIDRLVKERYGEISPYSTNSTSFGTTRHDMLAEYLKEHKELPPNFQNKIIETKLVVNPAWVEKHLAVEMWPNIVIHGTPDCFSPDWIIDFKTTSRDAKAYASNKQVLFYAWLLTPYGFNVKKVYYLCEIWNEERDKIMDYDVAIKDVTPELLKTVGEWAKDRAHKFKEAVEQYQPIGI